MVGLCLAEPRNWAGMGVAVGPTEGRQEGLQVGPSRAAAKGQEAGHVSDGFTQWLRVQRAWPGDKWGFYLSLVFHTVTLTKFWPALPAAHVLYYAAYIAATLGCLAWQCSGRPSYAAYRDWVQIAIRLDVFLAPPRVLLWEFSVDEDPPSLPGAPFLADLATLGLIMSKAVTFQLVVLPFAHPLALWPHMLVQIVCVARVLAVPSSTVCTTRFFSHPTPQGMFDMMHGWMQQLLGLFLLSPLSSAAGPLPRPAWLCSHVICWTQVMVGLVLSVAAQALWDARSFRAYCRERRCQQQQQREGEGAEGGCPPVPRQSWYDKACDTLNRRLLLAVVGVAKRPTAWVVAAVAAWDAVRIALW